MIKSFETPKQQQQQEYQPKILAKLFNLIYHLILTPTLTLNTSA